MIAENTTKADNVNLVSLKKDLTLLYIIVSEEEI